MSTTNIIIFKYFYKRVTHAWLYLARSACRFNLYLEIQLP